MVLSEIVNGIVSREEEILDILSWTVLPAELMRNPTYYDAASNDASSVTARLVEVADGLLSTLRDLRLVEKRGQDTTIKVTDLGKALHLQPGSTLLHVVRWFGNLSSKPHDAAKEMDAFSLTSRTRGDKEVIGDSAEKGVLEATLSQIPVEWKSAFRLSSAAKPTDTTTEDTNAKAVEGEGEEKAKTEDVEQEGRTKDLTQGLKRRLLLCLYFARLDLITPATANFLGMSKRAQKRQTQQQQDGGANGEEGTADNAGEKVSNGKGGEKAHQAAIEKLEKELAAEVLALMSSITSVGGRK